MRVPKRPMGWVYLIHFERPLAHAQHYLGSTKSLTKRMELHAKGNGSPLIAAVSKAGIDWKLVAFWTFATEKEARLYEQKLKKRRNGRSLCHVCRAALRQADEEASDSTDVTDASSSASESRADEEGRVLTTRSGTRTVSVQTEAVSETSGQSDVDASV